MRPTQYRSYQRPAAPKRRRHRRLWLVAAVLLVIAGFLIYKYAVPLPVEKAVDKLNFDASVSPAEQQAIGDAMRTQSKSYSGSVTAKVETTLETPAASAAVGAYLPVSDKYATRQTVAKADLPSLNVYVPAETDDVVRAGLAAALGLEAADLQSLDSLADVPDTAVAFVPASQLSPELKLLALDGAYYLDSFTKGAVFRQAVFEGSGAGDLSTLALNSYPTKDTTLKVNMTGVTALTRVMMKKLATVKDPKYFSQHIGAFLADADITHVSNEVSFKAGCTYSSAVFCAPPEMIEVLKDSGVDALELTGNHNNDVGNQYNTETINQYHGLGWHTFGGGLNKAEAAKPFVAEQKSTKLAFLGYNYPDSPNGGAIAGSTTAGANSFDFDRIEADIASAKQQGAQFVIVDIQFWECYAYPDGYVEYPQCDVPIPDQKEVFRKVADLGADMVVGSSAHQPQTYETYKGKPIYYGLGNLYFDQTSWPGTERGIVLTHYFVGGKLLQTKLSPTVYHTELQTKLMDNADAVKLLERLKTARKTAGLSLN